MKIGYIANYSREEVRWAALNGFKCVEVVFGEDLLQISDKKIKEVEKISKDNDIEISSLAAYMNHLDPEEKERKLSEQRFRRGLEFCRILGSTVISTMVRGDPSKSIDENMGMYQTVFASYADEADARGIKIALENWPYIHGYPIRIGNIALTPYAWDLMFKAVPSKAIGLEFDPSHLAWQGIDYLKAASKFGDRIYHVHAKDTEMLHEVLNERGIYGEGWWRYRIPGWGVIDWQRFIATLLDVHYNGNIVIENEDPIFQGPRFHEGLVLGLRHLSQFIP